MSIQVKASPDTLRKVRAIAVLAVVVLLAVMIGDLIKTQRYVAVQGLVVQTSSRGSQRNQSGQGQSIVHEVECVYMAGQTEYRAKFRTFFPARWEEGKLIELKYDPNLPARIREPFLYEAGIIMAGFALIFVFFTTYCLKALKKEAQARQASVYRPQKNPWH